MLKAAKLLGLRVELALRPRPHRPATGVKGVTPSSATPSVCGGGPLPWAAFALARVSARFHLTAASATARIGSRSTLKLALRINTTQTTNNAWVAAPLRPTAVGRSTSSLVLDR